MKLIFSFFIFISVRLYAAFQAVDPEDQVFLHIDRNQYHAGDTIRFRTYIRNYQTGKFETKSISLYCLLLDEAGQTIDSARLRITNSAISGWLSIPDNVIPGIYSVLSFTGRMMDYDPKFATISRIHVLPINQINNANLPGKKEQADSALELMFFPEGGTLIYDVLQKIAFTAKSCDGDLYEARGYLVDDSGEVITHFRTEGHGVGIIQYTPQRNKKYYAVPDGKNFSCVKWPLPDPDKNGLALSVINTFRELLFVQIRGNVKQGNFFHVDLIQNNDTVVSKEFEADSAKNFIINTEKLLPGSAWLVLSDGNRNKIAERYLFVNNHKLLNFQILPSASYSSCKNVFTIKARSQAEDNPDVMLSVSVIDSATGFSSDCLLPDITGSLLYERDFFDFLPESIKKKGLFNLDPKSADLLMMVYKRKSIIDSFIYPPKNPANDQFKLRYSGKNSISELKCVVPKTAEILRFTLVNNEVIVPMDSLNPQISEFYIMRDKRFGVDDSVTVNFMLNDEYIQRAKQTRVAVNKTITNGTLDNITDNNVIHLDAVTVKALGKRLNRNEAELMYHHTNVRTYSTEYFDGCWNFEQMLNRMHPYKLNTNDKTVVLRRLDSFTNPDPPALFVVNGNKLGYDYLMIDDLPASEIESVSILKGGLGYNVYGSLNGIIFVTTKTANGIYTQNKRYRGSIKNIQLFTAEKSLSISNKPVVLSASEQPSTIFWNDEVIPDRKGNAVISLPEKQWKGTKMIIINGVSKDNSVGTAVFYFSYDDQIPSNVLRP